MRIFLPFIKSLLIFPMLLLGIQLIEAQNMVVPAANKAKASPIVFNATTAKEGESIYNKNCVSCHGNPSKGNYLRTLNPPPGDPASAKFQNQTDGELFYNISQGNALMPQYKNILSEEERWKLVSYIRSFNKKYVQPAIKKTAGNTLSKAVQIDIIYNFTTSQISFLVISVVKKDTIPLKGSEGLLFVKRYFGNLQIGNSTKTNDKGIATFDFPKNIPGDKEGDLELIARINDNIYGEIITSKKIKIGIPTNNPSLIEKRAMWNVEAKAPIWILITFFSIVIGVWITIAYIILNIFRIKNLSTKVIK